MNGAWIEPQARAIHAVCMRTTALQLKALHCSVTEAVRTPAALGWELTAAARAKIFNALAAGCGWSAVAAARPMPHLGCRMCWPWTPAR